MEFKEVSKDSRRSIYGNTDLLNGKEISIIQLKKGKAIGGCRHNQDEYYSIISGCVIVSKDVENIISLPGDGGTFYSGVAHAFYATEDSIIMEWGISPEDKQNNPKEPIMLNRVKELNLL
jgi:uncharacterized cupin superfamily protein